MSEKTVTEREAVMRERAAFERGYCTCPFTFSKGDAVADMEVHDARERSCLSAVIAREYPLPKVTRFRVVPDPLSPCVDWRVIGVCGEPTLMCRTNDEEGRSIWKVYPIDNGGVHHMPTTERVKLWADLLANPTEMVDDDA